jgi:hypothetical protein
LIVAKSPKDALMIRRMPTNDPPNPRVRFFDDQISRQGQTVTVRSSLRSDDFVKAH